MAGTNWSAITTFEQILSEANKQAPFWTGILLMIWAVFVITFLPFGYLTAILSGSFLALITGIFLVYMDLVAWSWVLIILGVIVATIFYQLIFGKKE
jgi:Zn-dependent protease with chaperone function